MRYNETNGRTYLRISNQLALKLDSDQIQELFEREMDADGYFES